MNMNIYKVFSHYNFYPQNLLVYFLCITFLYEAVKLLYMEAKKKKKKSSWPYFT